MTKNVLLTLSIIGISGLSSCASRYPMLFTQSATSVKTYQEYCSEKKLDSETSKMADSLASTSRGLMDKGKNKDAYYTMELAVSYYRLALYENELSYSKSKLQKLEQSLVKAQDKLDTYEKVIHEIESGNK